jgi:hypothetical protein
MSLSTKVLLGLALGIVTGLFFGESVEFLEVPGKAFVVLLQMTVLPFVSVALIHSLGRLTTAEARSLARYASVFLLVIWALTLAVVVCFPLRPSPSSAPPQRADRAPRWTGSAPPARCASAGGGIGSPSSSAIRRASWWASTWRWLTPWPATWT